MTFFFHDMAGLILGTLLMPILGVLPGFALLHLLDRYSGFKSGSGWERFGWALLLAFAVLPAIDALVIRFIGVPVAFLLRVALALLALPTFRAAAREFGPIPRGLILLGALWWVVVVVCCLDVDWDGRLYQSLIVVDLVKHAAVVETIADHGVPLRDTFFARAQPAGYYYYFYCLPAELRWVTGGWISARIAFISTLVWAGLAFPTLLWRIGAEAGLIQRGYERRFLIVATMLCFVAGADLPFALIEQALNGYTLPQIELWSEEVRFALTSMIWVPHHMTALIACWTGVVLLCRTLPDGQRPGAASIAVAGLCFASTFGMSLWIAFAAVPIFAVWGAVMLWRGKRALAVSLVLAGLIAAIISLPQIAAILSGRGDQSFPIALSVRSFAFWSLTPGQTDVTLALILILLLPVAYAIQFGVFAIGGISFLRSHSGEIRQVGPMRSFLGIGAIVSFIVASFLCSTIINNDLGCRSIWFAQLAAIVWTASVLHTLPGIFMRRAGFRIILLLGIVGNAYDVFGLRFIRPPHFRLHGLSPNSEPATDLSEREAYEWAAWHLSSDSVIQHNAGLHRRLFNFGLYGRNRPAVADKEAQLFGASKQQVVERMQALQPIYDTPLPLSDMQTRARGQGIDFILLSDRDPTWKQQPSAAFWSHCIYRNARVCILPTKAGA